ncbi:hypothetical protein ARMGADRAFT_1088647 [Armillaria gallica]|uniref:DUF6533 domain-containing protein n=1 Tax=Armillaria gallica TaxID=47427 RepID=A0A2H3CQQ4_ARMGA|nr:hypothetical protein ARMGADRAFT_1088647 [Armillaria gallica]
MSTTLIPVDQILFIAYIPAAALVLILWDHCLTLAEEVATMWGPLNERILTKVIHLLNRYFTEAVLIYRLYAESQNVCNSTRISKIITCTLGVLLLFNVFVILITIYNALEEPRRPENSVLDSLRRDGARTYLTICMLWLLLLVSSVVMEATLFFSLLFLVCSLNANIAARMHLRVEGLRLHVHTHPVTIYRGSIED